MIKIAHFSTPSGIFCAQKLKEAGAAAALDFSVETLHFSDFAQKNIENAAAALLQGSVQAIVLPLVDVPIQKPHGVVVTAVLPRRDAAEVLLVNPKMVQPQQLLSLPTGARVGVSDNLQALQLADFRADVESVFCKNAAAAYAKLKSGSVDAAILSMFDIENQGIVLDEWVYFRFHPVEFLPQSGQGVIAVLALKDDVTTRRLFKKIHHTATATTINVERGIVQFLPEKTTVRAHCHRDAMGNFHAAAVAFHAQSVEKRTAKFSSSTGAGLSEQLAKQLV